MERRCGCRPAINFSLYFVLCFAQIFFIEGIALLGIRG
jgi:hypothetical protein